MISKILNNLLFFLLIIILSFVLPRLIPGSPLVLSESDQYVMNSMIPEQEFNAFKEYYAPEKPLLQQFFIYLKHISKLDMGYSFYYKMPVGKLISGRIGWTLYLSFLSILISSCIGIITGVNSSFKPGKKRHLLIGFTAIQSIPVFVMAILFQLFFCFRLHIFPSSGAYTQGVDSELPVYLADVIYHSALPLLILVISQIPSIHILTYNVASRMRGQHFVEMARYLNISEPVIKREYILKSSLMEILSKLNIQFLYAISGTLFVEAIFSYPGMGTLLKIAASSRDYTLLQGILLTTGSYGILINLIFNFIMKKADPRYLYDED